MMLVAVMMNGCQKKKEWLILAVTVELKMTREPRMWRMRELRMKKLRKMCQYTEVEGKRKKTKTERPGKSKTTSFRETCLLFLEEWKVLREQKT